MSIYNIQAEDMKWVCTIVLNDDFVFVQHFLTSCSQTECIFKSRKHYSTKRTKCDTLKHWLEQRLDNILPGKLQINLIATYCNKYSYITCKLHDKSGLMNTARNTRILCRYFYLCITDVRMALVPTVPGIRFVYSYCFWNKQEPTLLFYRC